jgi:hypothetical protein
MARAFLKLHDPLRAAFIAAQEDSAVRWLLVSIEAETNLVCKAQGSSSASVQQDFDGLVTELKTDCPAIVLFRLAPEVCTHCCDIFIDHGCLSVLFSSQSFAGVAMQQLRSYLNTIVLWNDVACIYHCSH